MKKRVQSRFIVHSTIPMSHKILAYLLNVSMWIYMIVVAIFFISAFVDLNLSMIEAIKQLFEIDNQEIRQFTLNAFNLFIFFFLVLLTWRTYNFNHFGFLRRRHYPASTTDIDILSLRLVDEQTYAVLQNSKVIIFEHNPIRPIDHTSSKKDS